MEKQESHNYILSRGLQSHDPACRNQGLGHQPQLFEAELWTIEWPLLSSGLLHGHGKLLRGLTFILKESEVWVGFALRYLQPREGGYRAKRESLGLHWSFHNGLQSARRESEKYSLDSACGFLAAWAVLCFSLWGNVA